MLHLMGFIQEFESTARHKPEKRQSACKAHFLLALVQGPHSLSLWWLNVLKDAVIQVIQTHSIVPSPRRSWWRRTAN